MQTLVYACDDTDIIFFPAAEGKTFRNGATDRQSAAVNLQSNRFQLTINIVGLYAAN